MSRICGVIIIAFLIVPTFESCSKSTESSSVEYYKIKIDSVQTQSIISLGDTVKLRLWGFVGSNGCYSFSSFETLKLVQKIDLTVWGKSTPANACATVIVELRGTQFTTLPTVKGAFEIVIHQPDGSTLKDTVSVQ